MGAYALSNIDKLIFYGSVDPMIENNALGAIGIHFVTSEDRVFMKRQLYGLLYIELN